jgi:hypothetical protein
VHVTNREAPCDEASKDGLFCPDSSLPVTAMRMITHVMTENAFSGHHSCRTCHLLNE